MGSTLLLVCYKKTVDKHEAVVGDTLTYNLIITNAGGPTAHTVILDPLEPQVFWPGVITSTYGTPGYDPIANHVGWAGSMLPTTTLVISYTVVITNVPPFNNGNVLTNVMEVMDFTNGILLATRMVETIVSTPTPRPTNTPRPTPTFTTIPTSTPIPTNTPAPTNTPTPTGTLLPVPTFTLEPTDAPVASPTVAANRETNPAQPAPTAQITSTLTPSIADWPQLLPETGGR